jgi:hypothetical protein
LQACVVVSWKVYPVAGNKNGSRKSAPIYG